MNIQIDSREKAKAITKIIEEFDRQNVKHYVSKLFVGDYVSLDNPRLVIDRKQNLSELAGNVCQQHRRFVNEINRAREHGIQLIFLVEHGRGINSIDDVHNWCNPRLKLSPRATTGKQLEKALKTMQEKYGIRFLFCEKLETGKRIIELLGGDPSDQ